VARFSTLILAGLVCTAATSCATAESSSTVSAPQSLQRLWQRSINPNADSAPAYAANVSIGGNSTSLLYVLGGNNTSDCNSGDPVTRATLYALDAKTGGILWTRSTTGPSRCTTAGPTVDPSGQWVYAPGLDGKIHRYDTATGEESTSGHWPRTVTLMPDVEKVSATPTIGTNHLYVTTSGFIGDGGHYEGHLVTIDLGTGRVHIFNSLCSTIRHLLTASNCSATKSGFFGRGQGMVDPVNHDVYVVSGNGPWNGTTEWGDSILRLDPSGARLIDSFTPTNQSDLEAQDNDLGSTAPALLPTIRRNGQEYHLLVQGGKGPACGSCSGAALRLLDRDNLSGKGGPGNLGGDLQDLPTPCGEAVLTAPAVWSSPSHRTWVFYANDCAVAGYRLSATATGFQLSRMWQVKPGGTTPVLTHGVLWLARNGEIAGLDPKTGAGLFSGVIGNVHWEYPLIAGGRIFITDENRHVTAFARG
jgi:PQQ-like domain